MQMVLDYRLEIDIDWYPKDKLHCRFSSRSLCIASLSLHRIYFDCLLFYRDLSSLPFARMIIALIVRRFHSLVNPMNNNTRRMDVIQTKKTVRWLDRIVCYVYDSIPHFYLLSIENFSFLSVEKKAYYRFEDYRSN